jgi:hypothetical protein
MTSNDAGTLSSFSKQPEFVLFRAADSVKSLEPSTSGATSLASQRSHFSETRDSARRTTFLPPEEAMDDVITRMRKFNDGLMEKYGA